LSRRTMANAERESITGVWGGDTSGAEAQARQMGTRGLAESLLSIFIEKRGQKKRFK